MKNAPSQADITVKNPYIGEYAEIYELPGGGGGWGRAQNLDDIFLRLAFCNKLELRVFINIIFIVWIIRG